jgi:hypothetical protein
MRKRADGLDGKTAVVAGSLETRRGVEMPQRQIVVVRTLSGDAERETASR